MNADRYQSNLEDDAKSGKRSVLLTDHQLENHLVNLLVTRGGQPAWHLVKYTGQAEGRGFMALGRLHERGRIHVDSLQFVTFCPPAVPWYRRIGSIHPAWVLVICLLLTTASCAAWIANVRAQHAASSTR